MIANGWLKKLPFLKQYQFRWVLLIAISWTFIDIVRFSIFVWIDKSFDYTFLPVTFWLVLVQFSTVFLFSLLMGYLIVVSFKKNFRNLPLWIGVIIKTFILFCIQVLLYSILFFGTYYFIYDHSFIQVQHDYVEYFFRSYYLLNNSGTWTLIFIITQLVVEINEKYSPGLFRDILAGKYIEPREERKIIMFIDLKDSTAIAEQLGHRKYFLFIKDFIYHVSKAVLKCGADIYQYVGDEVVLSWPAKQSNYRKSILALLEVRKELQKNNHYYRNEYAMVPDFRAGIHTGEVMIGEIGIIKKDLAMSGDTMNVTARIKNKVTDLNKKFIATRDFVDAADLQDFQAESAGVIELKGKENGLEVFILQL
jgi:adenylate cyclase